MSAKQAACRLKLLSFCGILGEGTFKVLKLEVIPWLYPVVSSYGGYSNELDKIGWTSFSLFKNGRNYYRTLFLPENELPLA
jgi:hypothetical protein